MPMIVPEKVFNTIQIGPVSKWTIPQDLPYFNGHFPGAPIFPAVGIIDASIYCLQRFTGRTDTAAKSVVNAKFQVPIVPGQSVEVEIKERGVEWQVEWRETDSGRELASLRIIF
jgi:3-hydroxyacyl-[acyl-carrier-protein] dehydratase